MSGAALRGAGGSVSSRDGVADRTAVNVSDAPVTVFSLYPGPEGGVVAVFGLTADCNGLTGFAILRASRWVVDCFGSAGT